jgi:DNA-binding IclR family transcriptional regulator
MMNNDKYDKYDKNEAFDRLQHLLVALRSGDELLSSDAARLTGLSEDKCRLVLEGLTRAGLMSCEAQGRYVRRTLNVVGS